MATFELTCTITLTVEASDAEDAEDKFNSMGDLLNHDNLNKAGFIVDNCELEGIWDAAELEAIWNAAKDAAKDDDAT